MIRQRPEGRLFEKGMQPERTALAWRRTGFALTVASLGATRVLGADFLWIWRALSMWVLAVAHRRHVGTHHILTGSNTAQVALHGGGLPAIVAALTAGMGCITLVATLLL